MTVIAEWAASNEQTVLPPETVHVWAWRLRDANASVTPDLSYLSRDEILHYERLRFRKDQLSYATSHGNTRRILAGYLRQSPDSLVFSRGAGGKPLLGGDRAHRLQFNLSHSKSFGLLAVAREQEVGIDVEEPRRIERRVAERYFSAAEIRELSTLENDDWLQGFLRCWTRKEAVLKAEGVGLRIPLNAFDVSVKAGEAPMLIKSRPPADFRFAWQLYDLSPAAGSVACLAVAAPPGYIHLFRYGTW